MTTIKKIGIWGTARAGKTTYLALLYHVFLREHIEWEIYAGSAIAEAFIKSSFERIFEEQRFPDETFEVQHYEYHVHSKSTGNKFTLTFFDAPGELFENYYDPEKRVRSGSVPNSNTHERVTKEAPIEIFNKLTECDGVLVFIDPARSDTMIRQRSYQMLLFQLFEDLRKNRREHDVAKTPPKIAFCVTKIDGRDTYWYRNHNNEICEVRTEGAVDCANGCLVYQLLGEKFMKEQLPGLHPVTLTRCFIVSSIGRDTDKHPNVSVGSRWQRSQTPKPKVFSTDGETHNSGWTFDEGTSSETFTPKSISNAAAINPRNLLQPILWITG